MHYVTGGHPVTGDAVVGPYEPLTLLHCKSLASKDGSDRSTNGLDRTKLVGAIPDLSTTVTYPLVQRKFTRFMPIRAIQLTAVFLVSC